MSEDSPAFDRAADDLERLSHMSRLEARGTLRLALREAGLAPKAVNFRSMLAVFERVMPTMLGHRGVRGADEVCRAIAASLRGPAGMEGSDADTPEKVSARMAIPTRPSYAPPAPPTPLPSSTTSDTGRLSAVPPPVRGSAPRR